MTNQFELTFSSVSGSLVDPAPEPPRAAPATDDTCVDPDGCTDSASARGLCYRHYSRHYHRGTLGQFPRRRVGVTYSDPPERGRTREASPVRRLNVKVARCYGRSNCTGLPNNSMRGLCPACYQRHCSRGTLHMFPTVAERLRLAGW